jgi:tetratricopeptide (TPR) repeat protein
MLNQSLTAKRIFLNAFLMIVAATIVSAGVRVVAQDSNYSNYDSERRRALALLDESKMLEALPILEKLAVQNPNDKEVQFFLGFCLFARSRDIKDPVAHKQERLRARDYLARAKAMGVKEPVLDQMLAAIPPDGGEMPKFSANPEAEAAMDTGESAYTHGDLEQALAAYSQAFQIDPRLYEAPLFAGDMQAKRGHNSTDAAARASLFDSAGEWYSKAIKVDPDRETAYRYWGDALLEYGKDDEARTKFIEAIIADPYNQMVYNGISRWSQKNQISLGHPRIDIPTNVTSNKPGETNITIDASALKGSDDGSAAWMMYGIVRAGWLDKKDGSRSDQFTKAYPAETKYRHSLAEELAALRAVAESVQVQTKAKSIKQLTPSLDNLMKLNDDGMLEPYILFARPDNGIALDYIRYRAANRDKLRRYWMTVVIGAK